MTVVRCTIPIDRVTVVGVGRVKIVVVRSPGAIPGVMPEPGSEGDAELESVVAVPWIVIGVGMIRISIPVEGVVVAVQRAVAGFIIQGPGIVRAEEGEFRFI